jgi:hypothetical protein
VSRNITDFMGKLNWCQSIVGRLNGSLELILNCVCWNDITTKLLKTLFLCFAVFCI